MSQENIIRAWKDSDFRNSLSEAEKALLPEHPAGLMQLSDRQLSAVAGGDCNPNTNLTVQRIGGRCIVEP